MRSKGAGQILNDGDARNTVALPQRAGKKKENCGRNESGRNENAVFQAEGHPAGEKDR